MTKQKEFIERIRREEFGIGVDLQGEARTVVDNMVRKYRNLLSTVAEDLNSKESHFLLELIQNADDNSYKLGVDPSLSFSLEGSRLFVRNNETGFEEKNVRALCSAGESSKKSEKRKGYIGEKGIGFKSIFKVTDSPEIHSNGFHFRFDRSSQEDLLGYVVPHWHEPDFRLDGRTTLVVPAKLGHRFSASTLADVSDSLLLFLQKLRRLDVTTPDGQSSYVRRDAGAVTTLVSSDSGKVPVRQDFLRKTFKVDVSDIHEPKRDGIAETEIVLVFPLSASGEAAPIPGCATYAFLPIRDFGFSFYIQADFVLASSREAIHEELAWNIRLRDAISEAFVESVSEFKSQPELARTYLKYLPTKGAVHDPFFAPVVGQLIEKLKAIESIPVAGGGWKRPAEVLLASEKIRELFSTEDALRIFGADYPKDDFVLPKMARDALGCKTLMTTDVASVFTEHLDWAKSRPTGWKARFYAYLAQGESLGGYVKLLQESPCIPLASGDLVAPSSGVVFFPLSVDKKYGFEHELAILDGDLFRQAFEISHEVQLLFSQLGVKQGNSFDLIQSHILRLHADDKWMGSDDSALIGHLRYVKDHLPDYLKLAALKGHQESVALTALRDGLFIGTKDRSDELWKFERIHELYLATEYQPEFDLEALLNDSPPALFVSSAYLAGPWEESSAQAQEQEQWISDWRIFFARLGVNASPRVSREPSGNFLCRPELEALLKSEKSSVRRAALEALDRNWSKYAGCATYWSGSGRNSKLYYTAFMSALRNTTAPTRKKTKLSLLNAYADNEDTRAVLGDHVVFVEADLGNAAFLDACGVTYKVDAAACLKRLRQMQADDVRSSDQLRKIYRCLDNLWEKERAIIEPAFSQDSLIRVGSGDSAKWVSPSDACWKETGNRFLDRLYPSLGKAYRDFHGFFVKKLKVPEALAIDNWVDALKNLDDVEKDGRPELALYIYRRLSQAIDSHIKSGGDLTDLSWVSDLETWSLLLNKRDEMVDKSEHLYADDRPEISKLFGDVEEISFFNVSANHLPSVGALIDALEMPRVSEMVEVEASDGIEGSINNRLTAKLREMLIPIARIAYSHSHAAFKDGIETGLFNGLSRADVFDVDSLLLTVTLGEWSKEMSWPATSRGNDILLDAATRSKHDYVAMEVEKRLKLRKGASDLISRVLMEASTEDANDYLAVKRIPDLTGDEVNDLMASVGRAIVLDGPSADEAAGGLDPFGDEDNISDDGGQRNSEEPCEEVDSEHGVARILLGNGPRQEREHRDVPGNEFGSSLRADAARIDSTGRGEPRNANATSQAGHASLQDDAGGGKQDDTTNPKAPHERSRLKQKSATRSGRLLSYAEPKYPKDGANGDRGGENSTSAEYKLLVERAAVKFFLEKASSQWRRVEEMSANNPGFDFFAEAFDGNHQFVEIKGQGGAWTEEGVALTPTELRTASQHGEHYWLCVVEFALDEARRQLCLVQDPFGKADQFRFDRGWQDVAEKSVGGARRPVAGLCVTIPELGKVRILEVIGTGLLAKLKVELGDKSVVFRTYSPATMKLSAD